MMDWDKWSLHAHMQVVHHTEDQGKWGRGDKARAEYRQEWGGASTLGNGRASFISWMIRAHFSKMNKSKLVEFLTCIAYRIQLRLRHGRYWLFILILSPSSPRLSWSSLFLMKGSLLLIPCFYLYCPNKRLSGMPPFHENLSDGAHCPLRSLLQFPAFWSIAVFFFVLILPFIWSYAFLLAFCLLCVRTGGSLDQVLFLLFCPALATSLLSPLLLEGTDDTEVPAYWDTQRTAKFHSKQHGLYRNLWVFAAAKWCGFTITHWEFRSVSKLRGNMKTDQNIKHSPCSQKVYNTVKLWFYFPGQNKEISFIVWGRKQGREVEIPLWVLPIDLMYNCSFQVILVL